MKRSRHCLAAGFLALACGSGATFEDVEVSTNAITAPGATALFDLPTPIRFHQAASGTQAQVEQLFQRYSGALGYVPVALSGVKMPSGAYRFSSVMQKLPGITGSTWYLGLTQAEYSAQVAQHSSTGFRVADVSARPASNGIRYDVAFIREATPPASWAVEQNLLRQDMQTTIEQRRAQGQRVLRIHHYPGLNSMRYSAAFVADGKDSRAFVAEACATFPQKVQENRDAGYRLLDVSVQRDEGTQRCSGAFVADPDASQDQLLLDVSAANLAETLRSYTSMGYSLSDLESYSADPNTDQPRYALVWHRSLSSVFDTNATGLSPAAQGVLTGMRNRIEGYGVRTAFLVENLQTGKYLGFHSNDPMYVASISKVPIAIAVLRQVQDTTLDLTTTLPFENSDLLVDDPADDPILASDVGTNITVDRYVRAMLNHSSTNATDRLLRHVTPAAVNTFMGSSGHVNLGEITSICELDKRIVEQVAPCARSVACNVFEDWWREDGAGGACLSGVSVGQPYYDRYYATLANSATPLEFGRLWRRLLGGELLDDQNRDYLVDVLDATENGLYDDNLMQLEFFQKMGTKPGNKKSVMGVVGMLWAREGATGAVDDLGQYSFSMFTEGFLDQSDAQRRSARLHLRGLMEDAITVLESVD